MNTNTFMEELPMVIVSSLAIVAIVILVALHVPAADSLIVGTLAPLAYFGANGLIRLNSTTSSQQLTTEQVQQLITSLSQLQAPVQPSPAPVQEPKPIIVPSLPVPSPSTEQPLAQSEPVTQ